MRIRTHMGVGVDGHVAASDGRPRSCARQGSRRAPRVGIPSSFATVVRL
jgi:hypothetical protein